MNPSKEVLDNKLAKLERASNCSEIEIYLELGKLKNGNIEDEPCPEWVYESMAFAFLEKYTDKKNGGGTYFGPLAVWPTNDGRTVENPSLAQVNEDAIAYWEERSQSTNNPLLKARYAGLVWDLSLPVTGKHPHYSLAHRYCEAIFEIAERRSHKYDVDVIQKLKHALSIAISTNSEELIRRTKEAILKYEDLVAEDSKPGLWGFSFDFLVGNKKVDLSDKEEREIIEQSVRRAMTGLKIVEFDAAYAADFKRLNLVWLERYFQVEPIDLEVLSNPEETILKPGGMIFFALLDGAVVGTCALIKHTEGLFELSKMAVADRHQGQGIGTQLLSHVIAWARSRSIQKLFVETNTVLESAVRLYQRLGFRAIAYENSDAHYDRTNLKLELDLQQ